MSIFKSSVLLTTLAASLSAASPLLAQTPPQDRPTPPVPPAPPTGHGPRGGDHRGPEGGGERGPFYVVMPVGAWWKNADHIKALGLTTDQLKRIDDAFLQNRMQLIDLHAALEKEQLQLEPLLAANPVDQGRALGEISRIADMRASLEKQDARMLLSIRGVLTADQWTKLQTLHRGGPMHGQPGGPESGPGKGAGQHGGRGAGGRGPQIGPQNGPQPPAAPLPPAAE